jgi:hypothetical protein
MPVMNYNAQQCACGDCFDWAIESSVWHDIFEVTSMRDAVKEGFEPQRYCISCINNKCYEGKPHR